MKKLRVLMAVFTTNDPPPADPPAADPPAGDPPASDPGAGDPPASDPPAGDPPSTFGDPPADPPAGDDPPADPPAVEGVPEAYEFTPPEGLEINSEVFTGFTGELGVVAKELGLTQAQAQGIAEFATKFDVARSEAAGPAAIAEASEIFSADLAAWKTAVGATKAQEAVSNADKVAGFLDPEFLEIMNSTGLIKSPGAIRTFAAIGAVMGEDSIPKPLDGASDADSQETKLAKLYPSMAKK